MGLIFFKSSCVDFFLKPNFQNFTEDFIVILKLYKFSHKIFK
jgi:hypothetical protein